VHFILILPHPPGTVAEKDLFLSIKKNNLSGNVYFFKAYLKDLLDVDLLLL
jgi:hypothetical protein